MTLPSPVPHDPHAFTRPQTVYLWLCSISLASLLVSDIVGIKLFHFSLPFTILGYDAVEHTCGMLTFPITFILTDLVNEYYGKKAARRLTYIGVAMGVFVFVVINVAQAMPYLDAPYNVSRGSFDAIFGSAKVMYVASLTAYFVGQLSDIFTFGLIKRFTGQKWVWLRATGSTIFSQFLDSFVVSYLAFSLGRKYFGSEGGPRPADFHEILSIAVTGYSLKFVLAIGVTPLIYAGRFILHRWFGMRPLGAE
jgi:uncharacterized integral membrane protein (TIGR00697 family)